ncbi:MAG: hypothetical protein M3Q98_00405 [Actinomycetota bacterium]|nr:hypothetical protein [Actinomycetota bacterium]
MSDDRVSGDPVETEPAEETDAQKKARLKRAAELLGDLVPTTTRDETSEGWSEKSGTSREEEFLRDVPPHHG